MQNRVMKAVKTGLDTVFTFYVRDAQGNVMGVYTRTTAATPTITWSEQYLYGSGRLGSVQPGVSWTAASTYTGSHYMGTKRLLSGQKRYELTNHLGNVLTTIGDRKIPVDGAVADNTAEYYTAVVHSAQDYYPFGMEMPGRSFQSGGYRYGFNGKEKDNEINGNGSSIDFGARMLDTRLGRWLSVDPYQGKYSMLSSFCYSANSPIFLKDPDGRDIIVAFTGGPTGGGATLKLEDAGTTGALVLAAQAEAITRGIEFDGTVIAPGWTASSSVENGYTFIKEHYSTGETVILYGYSYGVDFAVELAEKLQSEGIKVQLLVTVDGSDGPLQNSTVNTTIPDNVAANQNIYQTDDSGSSSLSRAVGSLSSGSSDSCSSDSGSCDSPGSNGGPNKAKDESKTKVYNHNVTGKGVTHGNIDEKTFQSNVQSVKNNMSKSSAPASQKPNDGRPVFTPPADVNHN
jgi:RHS repeat-associated protein